LVVFDLLYLNGHELRKLPLIDRKALLKKTVADTDTPETRSQGFEPHAAKLLSGIVEI
jgi:bifunctional non-homologous end joining protein LigD